MLLVACIPNYTAVRGPSGRAGYSIRCRGSVGNCYADASVLCPNGYDQFGGQDRSGSFVTSDAYGNQYVNRVSAAEILVECR